MFNSINNKKLNNLLSFELHELGINTSSESIVARIGDEEVNCKSMQDCLDHIQTAIKELKEEVWHVWNNIVHISELILHNNTFNKSNLDNILFLNAVKQSFILSNKFSKLKPISESIKSLFYADVSKVHENLIYKFNKAYIRLKVIHQLILNETYRTKVISAYMKMSKTAQISGPWANADLPMAERVWSWDEDEEYFANRSRARREQTRYNPETGKSGFYYVWQELNDDPYSFDDIEDESPYPTRDTMRIP